MKKITLLLFVLAQSMFLFGQNDQQKEVEIRAMELTEARALLQKDIPTLEKIWSPDFMVNAPLNAVFIGGQVELVRAGIISYTSFIRTIEHVMVLKDVVITMGSETVVPTAPDPMAGQTVQRRYTNIWIKERGGWVLVARHANNICPTTGTSSPQKLNTGESSINDLKVEIRRNPSSDLFHLNFPDNVWDRISILVLDSHGRIMEKQEAAKGTKMLSVGKNYPAGIYFAQITNGQHRKTVKLVKQ